VRGLKWVDCDLKNQLFLLRQGVVRKHRTNLKTEASRRSLPMSPELAQALLEWRNFTPYNQDDDWVFASPYTKGKRPYWPESALADHIRPAAEQAKITKRVGWNTFRHSLALLLGDKKEDRRIVQEIMRPCFGKDAGRVPARQSRCQALRSEPRLWHLRCTYQGQLIAVAITKGLLANGEPFQCPLPRGLERGYFLIVPF
jgi:integrase